MKWAGEKIIYDGRSCSIQGHSPSFLSLPLMLTLQLAITLVMGDLGSTFWHVLSFDSIDSDLTFFTGVALSQPILSVVSPLESTGRVG